MNAWTIYWILQLDTINFVLVALTLGIGAFAGITAIAGALNKSSGTFYPELSSSKKERELGEAQSRTAKRMLTPFFILAALAAFSPSTKTAAAMVIVPAIANNETIRKEAGDLYSLAKQALREAVTDEPKKEAK